MHKYDPVNAKGEKCWFVYREKDSGKFTTAERYTKEPAGVERYCYNADEGKPERVAD